MKRALRDMDNIELLARTAKLIRELNELGREIEEYLDIKKRVTRSKLNLKFVEDDHD